MSSLRCFINVFLALEARVACMLRKHSTNYILIPMRQMDLWLIKPQIKLSFGGVTSHGLYVLRYRGSQCKIETSRSAVLYELRGIIWVYGTQQVGTRLTEGDQFHSWLFLYSVFETGSHFVAQVSPGSPRIGFVAYTGLEFSVLLVVWSSTSWDYSRRMPLLHGLFLFVCLVLGSWGDQTSVLFVKD